MGTDALLTSGVTEKMLYLVRDPRPFTSRIKAAYLSNGECGTKADELDDQKDQDSRPPNSRILIFLIVELIGFGATFAITQVGGFDTTRERL
jgi:hypothetical protein